jgi:2-(1,2-epoxy-1,2-dihydrophenyl)acetyl-CoA isomerase
MTSGVTLGIAGAVATITLDRPDKLNAFNPEMLHAITRHLAEAVRNADVAVVVLTGAGRAFSAGQDLGAINRGEVGPDLGRLLERDYGPLVTALVECPKVTIAALNGAAVGAAANIALACDIVLAARSAYLMQAFVRIGLIPDVAGTWLLPRIVGSKRALALALTGDRVGAEDALAMGLVYRVFADERFAEDWRTFAETIASGPRLAHRLIKEAFRRSADNDLATQLKLEADLQREAGHSADFREAVAAFNDKRPPVFGKS